MTAFAVFFAGCLPKNLDKYRKNKSASQSSSSDSMFSTTNDITSPAPKSSLSSKSSAAESINAQNRDAPRASIYALDNQTYRFLLSEHSVWDAAINVLLRNYNLTIVNEKNRILTTEWDSFYLNDEVFRNKISIRMRKSNYGVVDVTVHNNVEKLSDSSQAVGTVGAVWLPANDEAKEVSRILQNMALVLNQPPPVFPPGMEIATGINSQEAISR